MNIDRTEGSNAISFGSVPFDSAEKQMIQKTLQKIQPITNSNISQLTSDITLYESVVIVIFRDRVIKSRPRRADAPHPAP